MARRYVLCTEDAELVQKAMRAFTQDHRYLEAVLQAAHQVKVRTSHSQAA